MSFRPLRKAHIGDPILDNKRYTAGKKTELVVLILKQEKTLVDACRENDLQQSEVKKWIDQFLEDGRHVRTG